MLFIYILLILISFVFLTFILEFLIYFFSKIFIITKIILSFKVSNGYAGVKLSFKMPVKNQRQYMRQYRLNKKRKRANDIRREARRRAKKNAVPATIEETPTFSLCQSIDKITPAKKALQILMRTKQIHKEVAQNASMHYL